MTTTLSITDKIANGNVTLEKIAAVGNDKVMTVDNAGVVAWEDRANFSTTLSLGVISGDATNLIKPNSVLQKLKLLMVLSRQIKLQMEM